MPSGKHKNMEDTWAPEELHKSLKGDKKSRTRDKDKEKDREHRRKDKDDDRKHRREKDGDKDRRDRKHRDKENGEADEKRHREKDRDRDKDRDRKKKHDDEKDRKSKDKDRKHRDEDDDERRRRREEKKKKEDGDRDDKKRRPKDEDSDRKHRRREEDGERRKHKDDDKPRRKHRDDEDDDRRRRRHDGENDEDEDREKRRRERKEKEKRQKEQEEEERARRREEKAKEEKKEKPTANPASPAYKYTPDGKAKKRSPVREIKQSGLVKRQIQSAASPAKFKAATVKKDSKRGSSKSSISGGSKSSFSGGSKSSFSGGSKSSISGGSKSSLTGSIKSSISGSDKSSLSRSSKDSLRRGGKGSDRKSVFKLVSSRSSHSTNLSVNQEEVILDSTDGGGDDEYNYEDDFEDYDDDFEDDDEEDEMDGDENRVSKEEMNEILKAMNDENDRLLTESRRNRRDDSPDSRDESHQARPTTASRRTFINFVSAKERKITQKAAGKAKQRGRDLMSIIDLDVVSFNMFDMPPVSEYELYMRSFGRSDTKQAYIQTNDDNIEKEIQTEDIESREKWTQHPADTQGAVGGTEGEDHTDDGEKPIDSVKLAKFISQAGQVMAILLEENKAMQSQTVDKQRSNICVSEDFIQLGAISLLKYRHVIFSHFSPVQTNLLITVHSPPNKESSKDLTGRKGILCVWNVNEPSHPQKILVCESQPQCCCFSPTKPTLAFGGMRDGSLAVWDLREATSLHKMHRVKENEFLLRFPTYNTAGVMSEDNHHSGVVAVVPIIAQGDSASASGEDSGESGMSFQLASVEDNAVLHLWVVAELSQPDPAGSQSDYGLAPGGRVKLMKSSSIVLENPLRDTRLRTTMRAFDLCLLPKDPSHFYVATDTGCIIHGVRYGGKAPPKAYRADLETPLEITSIDFSPFTEPVFLVGCADGSLRLYNIKSEKPLIQWSDTTEGRAVQCVRWCRSRPSVFYVVDEGSRLYIWDLLMSDNSPMKEERMSDDKVASFAVSNDYAATGLGSAGRRPQMFVGLESGRMEVHTVSNQFSALMPEEVDQFADFLSRVQ